MKKSQQFQGTSLRHLVLGAISMLRFRIVPVLVAAVTFALLMAVASTFINAQVQRIQDDIVTRSGISEEVLMEQVTKWVAETSDLDLLKFAANHTENGFSFHSVPTADNAAILYVLRTGPYISSLFFFDLFINFLAFVYFLVFFSDPLLSPVDAVKRLPGRLLRIIGLGFWMIIRSFSWIPIVGPVFAFYFFPRFVLAPSLVASGDSTVRESIHMSMARTSRQWFHVIGRFIVLTLLSILLLWFLIVFASVISLFSAKLGVLLWLIGFLIIIAFQAAYFVVFTAIMM